MNAHFKSRLLASSMIVGAAGLVGGQAYAADAAAAASTDATQVQELVVTGTRIPTPNLTAVSPITTVNAAAIKLQGATNVEDFLNNLPSVFADQGQYESNGSTGIATVNLRGLGAQRTLVLIDGKRVQPGDATTPVADINFIPPQLIDRVDVLTGGAGAVYGSDAVAGVVNFIMKKNFQGIEIDTQTSIAEHGNDNQQVRAANAWGHNSVGFPLFPMPSGGTWTGQRHTASIIVGVNAPDDKGNLEGYFTYTSIDPVLLGQFDYGVCALTTNNGSANQYCGGSSTSATGRLTPGSGPNTGNSYNILGANSGGVLAPWARGLYYNYAPLNYVQRPDTRYNAGFYATYNLSKAVNFYSSFMFMNDTSTAQIGPSGAFYSSDQFTIPCNDPLLSTTQAATLCGAGPYAPGQNATGVYIGRRNVEGGGRDDTFTHNDYRIVVGLKGDIGQGWHYDFSMQWGQVQQTHTTGNYFQDSKIIDALNVITDPVTGKPACAVAVSGADKACVPYNLWTPGGITPAALAYVSATAAATAETTQQVVTLSLSNDLARYGFKSPYAHDGVGVSFGGEYHREFLETTYDALFQNAELEGNGGATKDTRGSQTNKDFFAEVRVPVAQDLPYVKDFDIGAGYRYSDYTHGGGASAYKVEANWSIVPDFRVRASYERSVRAPNVQELFDPFVEGSIGGSDPCAGKNPTYTAAQCFNTFETYNAMAAARGVTPIDFATFQSTIYEHISQCIVGQCEGLAGGNTQLRPEVGKTVSVGFVFEPTFFRPFSLSVDYFSIHIDNVINALNFTQTLNNCAQFNNPLDCSIVFRASDAAAGYSVGLGVLSLDNNGNVTGTGGGEYLQTLNQAALITRGVDVAAAYRMNLRGFNGRDLGSVAFNFQGTYVHTNKTVFGDGTSIECAGAYGPTCGTPTPKWRHQFAVTWNTPWKLQARVNWRYLNGSNVDGTGGTSAASAGLNPTYDRNATDLHIPAFSYFDVALTYQIKQRYKLRMGVNNLFDRTPPLLDQGNYAISSPPAGNGNTFPQVYDPLGRVLFVGLTADF